MKLYLHDGFGEAPLATVPKSTFNSIRALGNYLRTASSRYIGGNEGRDWRIKQAPRGTLIPIYAASRDGTITLTIA